jgi:hypothetical protein
VLSLRQSLNLPLGDLLCITREYINAAVSRAGISRLKDIIPKAKSDTPSPKKTLKDYEPDFVRIDIKSATDARRGIA